MTSSRAPSVEERFSIEERVGRGAHGEVFRARDLATGAPVAVKRLLDRRDAAVAGRFEREAILLSQIDSPHVVRYVAHGRDRDGRPCLVLEWLSGQDLRKRQAARPLSPREAVEVARQAALGLHALHGRGIVHRDVKPSNFFLVDEPTAPAATATHAPAPERAPVKLIDLGIASGGGQAQLTAEGWIIGTPAYMSPEQARGDMRLTPLSDVFSLGVVLFELVAGRRPFVGEDAYAVLARVVLEDAPRLSELDPDAPLELEAIVARALNKRPDQRFASALAMSERLSRIALPEARGMGAPRAAGTEPRARVSTLREQRVVTAAFAAFTGQGALGGLLLSSAGGAQPGRTPLGALPAAMQRFVALAEDGGARVYPTLGSRMIAVFGGAHSRGDEGQRAAATALAAAALPGIRVAVATGRVDADSEGMSGAAIERGAALLDRGDGAVRLDPSTAGLLSAHFHVEEREGGAVLLGERSADQPPPLLLGKRVPCLGRDRELSLLEGFVRECAAEGVARVVLVTGPAGAGKSRLWHELSQRLPALGDPEILRGRATSLGAGAPLGLLGQTVRRAAGLHGGEPPEVHWERIEARLARRMGAEAGRRAARALGEAAGAPLTDAEARSRALDPIAQAAAVRRALEAWLLAECEARPVVLALDDLQWADLPSMQAMDGALRALSDSPLLVIGLARPEVHDQLPGLWERHALHEVRLGPLGRRASATLVTAALGERAADAVAAQLIERAAGNPFALEELIRAVDAGRADALPASVLGIVQARLDALGAPAKRVLRAASAFGERFRRSGVAALVGGDNAETASALSQLTAREIVAPVEGSQPAGDVEYAFRHAQVREAAYAMLTEADRRLAHRLAAAWLEQRGEDKAAAEHRRHGAAG